ncbi:MAG TPA: LysM peptidoglycan-binding domain-containing protein, partial [Longimicrobium sp.]|nr:LysM peptidoglycan-binding domain-containing protein [Longimicrobium sp.]
YGVTTAQLRALNPEDTSGALEPGAVLRLPPAPRPTGTTPARPAPATPERPAAAPARPAAARRRTHTVAAGETLFGLARRYGVSTEAIRRANDLASDQLRAGQTIVIPAP